MSSESMGLVVRTVDEIRAIGEAMAKSCMMGCDTPEKGMIVAMTCMTERISPLRFSQTYHIVDNKVTMRADAMVARFQELGGVLEILSRTADLAKVRLTFRNTAGEFALSWVDAEKEPFTKDRTGKIKTNYATPRARMQMLWARVVSDGIRTVCPLVNSGTYTAEELSDPDFELAPPIAGAVVEPAQAAAASQPDETAAPRRRGRQPAAMKQAEGVTVSPPIVAEPVVDAVETDATRCPHGSVKGKLWTELTVAQLEVAATWMHAKMTDAHRAEAQKALDAKKGGAA